MTAKEIARYNAKGLFTVTQLSYTFRSRRRPKRTRAAPGPHYFSLQAQALREQKIFVHGSVNLNIDQPRVYFDIEGTPDTQSNYLIGALFVERGKEEFASFWADHDYDSGQVFSEFLRRVGALPRHHLVHFGSYETSALRQAKPLLPDELGPVLEDGDRSIYKFAIRNKNACLFSDIFQQPERDRWFPWSELVGAIPLRHSNIGLEGEMASYR